MLHLPPRHLSSSCFVSYSSNYDSLLLGLGLFKQFVLSVFEKQLELRIILEINGTGSEVLAAFLFFSIQQDKYISCNGNVLFLILFCCKSDQKEHMFLEFPHACIFHQPMSEEVQNQCKE